MSFGGNYPIRSEIDTDVTILEETPYLNYCGSDVLVHFKEYGDLYCA